MRDNNFNWLTNYYTNNFEQLTLFAFYYSKNRQDAKDAVQEVFLHLITQGINLAEFDFPKAYLKTCIKNEAIKIKNKNTNFPLSEHEYKPTNYGVLDKDIETYLKLLTRKEKLSIHYKVYGFKLKEISIMMALTKTSVSRLQNKAKNKLQGLKKELGYPDEPIKKVLLLLKRTWRNTLKRRLTGEKNICNFTIRRIQVFLRKELRKRTHNKLRKSLLNLLFDINSRKVATLLLKGLSNQEIANQLNLDEKIVRIIAFRAIITLANNYTNTKSLLIVYSLLIYFFENYRSVLV